MESICQEKRKRLAGLCGSGIFSVGRRPLIDQLELTIDRKEPVALIGVHNAGKTSLAQALIESYARKYAIPFPTWHHIYQCQPPIGSVGAKILARFEESAREFGLLVVDELTLLWTKHYAENKVAFFDLVTRLNNDKIPVILIYHRMIDAIESYGKDIGTGESEYMKSALSVYPDIKMRLPFMTTLSVSAKMTTAEMELWFGDAFAGTRVEVSERTKTAIMVASEGYCILLAELCHKLLKPHRIANNLHQVKIEDEPPPIKDILDSWVNGERTGKEPEGLYRAFILSLTRMEKLILRDLVNGHKIEDYQTAPINEMKRYGIIGDKPAQSAVLRRFIDAGFWHSDAFDRLGNR